MDTQRHDAPDHVNEDPDAELPPESPDDPETTAHHPESETEDGEKTPPEPDAERPAERVDEWEAESFPASDPPASWAGPDTPPA